LIFVGFFCQEIEEDTEEVLGVGLPIDPVVNFIRISKADKSFDIQKAANVPIMHHQKIFVVKGMAIVDAHIRQGGLGRSQADTARP
jgi:hypothetical protein